MTLERSIIVITPYLQFSYKVRIIVTLSSTQQENHSNPNCWGKDKIHVLISALFLQNIYISKTMIPLPDADAVLSVLQCVSVDRAAAASCVPQGLYAEQPVGPAASCEPPSAPCSPVADAGSPASEWTHQAH